MGEFLSIELSDEAKRLIRSSQTMPQRALQAIARAMDKQNQLTIGHVLKSYASFPKDQKPTMLGLRVMSGQYRRSVHASKAVVTDKAVVSGIGSNLKYARIHEFGGKTKPHLIKPKRGKALHFMLGGRMIFAGAIKHPGSKIPARRPISKGIEDRLGNYGEAISAAVVKAMGTTTGGT